MTQQEVAEVQGKSVTFMAKPHHDEAGSSCHIHLNLTSAETGKNAFAGDKDLQGIKCSDTFRHFLGGWIKYTPGTPLSLSSSSWSAPSSRG
jgi:glutamine synthetase